jgi:biopolymer transport protein ExbB
MMSEVYDFLARGGPLMVPIALCSIVGLAIFLERLWVLQQSRILPLHFMRVLDPYLRKRDWVEARRLCDSSQSSMATILRGGLRYAGQGRTLVREGMEESGRRVSSGFERHLGMLGAIANVTPLLGLLGTVTGMIKVFQRVDDAVRATGDVQPQLMANGIWEALMTTAAGLSVAIPVFIAFKYLEGRSDRLMSDLEERADEIADSIGGDRTEPLEGEAAGAEAE